MSTRHIPYPPDFDIDHAAAHHEERRRHVLQALDAGDVLSVLDDLIAQEPDPAQHPCYAVVCWLLDRQWSVDGGVFWERWRSLCQQALDRCVDEALQAED